MFLMYFQSKVFIMWRHSHNRHILFIKNKFCVLLALMYHLAATASPHKTQTRQEVGLGVGRHWADKDKQLWRVT